MVCGLCFAGLSPLYSEHPGDGALYRHLVPARGTAPGTGAVRLSGCLAVRLSGCPAVRLSGCPRLSSSTWTPSRALRESDS